MLGGKTLRALLIFLLFVASVFLLIWFGFGGKIYYRKLNSAKSTENKSTSSTNFYESKLLDKESTGPNSRPELAENLYETKGVLANFSKDSLTVWTPSGLKKFSISPETVYYISFRAPKDSSTSKRVEEFISQKWLVRVDLNQTLEIRGTWRYRSDLLPRSVFAQFLKNGDLVSLITKSPDDKSISTVILTGAKEYE